MLPGFDGKFNGIDGRYNCSTTCSAMRDLDGTMTLVGLWKFTPTGVGDGEGETPLVELMIPDIVDDEDYLYFGYWLEYNEKTG